MSAVDKKKLSKDVQERGVDVGVCIITESSDSKVVITRRSPQMRTFPGTWVPPGGHIGKSKLLY